MEFVKVVWEDSNVYIEQGSIGDDWKYCEMESVGFLIEKTEKQIVLARDLIDGVDARGVLVIPMCCVKRVESYIFKNGKK